CGAVIARNRPSNPIGWLFVADGVGHATAAVMAPAAQALHDADASIVGQRAALTVLQWSWPWSIGLLLPVALLLFPDGRLPSPRWRLVLILVVATAPLFVVEVGTDPARLRSNLPSAYLTLGNHAGLVPLWVIGELRTSAALACALVGLVVRYRRADESQRQQLMWLLLAAMAVLAIVVPWSFVAGTPVAVLFAIPLIPIAVAVAIVRHQLLDIRLVVSRALAWLLLSVVAIGAYVALVALLDQFVAANVGRSAVATVLIALLLAPLLPRLQRRVDRAMYGDRGDPARVASRVGQRLRAGGEGDLALAAAAVRQALRLPYAAIRTGDEVLGADGRPDGAVHSIPLDYAGRSVGDLVVGLRPGERDLSAADRDVLLLVATSLAVAVHATRLAEEVQASRQRLVLAREEERRRLRRDLHDGLGPVLTGLSLTADAAANLVERDPARTLDLLTALRRDARAALVDVRCLVDNLRPPSLDELGLLEALRQRVQQLSWHGTGREVRVDLLAPDRLPVLPAAIEVAAYRIATEALTNVVRHSGATTATVRLDCADALMLDIRDDGKRPGDWSAGVGLTAMRERTAEVGGSYVAGPTPDGGRVQVSLPLAPR
ncbi:MAG: sensor histidine kinase, partial [Actinomycetota bacterium]|nr:sensor histidine kinase [Actinomycetota bacterium]